MGHPPITYNQFSCLFPSSWKPPVARRARAASLPRTEWCARPSLCRWAPWRRSRGCRRSCSMSSASRSCSTTPTIFISGPEWKPCASWAGCRSSWPGTSPFSPTRAASRSSASATCASSPRMACSSARILTARCIFSPRRPRWPPRSAWAPTSSWPSTSARNFLPPTSAPASPWI